jgi:hypothetical protein
MGSMLLLGEFEYIDDVDNGHVDVWWIVESTDEMILIFFDRVLDEI